MVRLPLEMTNLEIADTFEKMARVIAFKGGDRFRIIAYERAGATLRDIEDLEARAAAGTLRNIPGIGEDLERMIQEGLSTGRIRHYEQERKGISDDLIELMSIPGLGPKTVSSAQSKPEHC
jgi:DNA polymerase (family X)